MDTPGKRILKWREHIGKTPKQFEALTGIPYSTLKTLETDPKKGKPSFDVIAKLRRTFPELNIDWLFDEGDTEPMLRENRTLRSVGATGGSMEPDPEPEMVAETNKDPYFHRYHALLDMVKTGFFGSPEQLLRKKAKTSADAASLYETVDQIASECKQAVRKTVGFEQTGRQLQLA